MKKSHRNTIPYLVQLDLIAGLFVSMLYRLADFCSESVGSCLRSLGFNNRLCRKTLQVLSSVSLRCSFEIWLYQSSKSWSLPHPVSMSNSEPTQKKSNLNGVSAHNDHHACTPVYSVPSLKTPNKHCGIINKENTCYANVIYNA